MSSEGTGAPISQQDAADLLHKLITESTKVVANFRGTEDIKACVVGTMRLGPDGRIWVLDSPSSATSLSFDPLLSVTRKYGDERALIPDGGSQHPKYKIRSLLSFVMKDGSTLGIFELADKSDD